VIPIEVVQKMLEKQVEQENSEDVTVFQNKSTTSRNFGGFDWVDTSEQSDFWTNIIYHKMFNLFFKKYPKIKNEKLILYYIKSIKNKGNEIIKVLIEKGGINTNKLCGSSNAQIYYINSENVISLCCTNAEYNLIKQFGTELFLSEQEEYSFIPFEQVLVRDNYNELWTCDKFSFIKEDSRRKFICIGGNYTFCIPFKGNEYLLGTNEQYSII
jgi:hypothetical protein